MRVMKTAVFIIKLKVEKVRKRFAELIGRE